MHPELVRHQRAIERLCRQFRVRRLELFGSAASGRDRPGESDFDFLVEFESLPPGVYADAYFGLLEALEGLLGRPVDLVASEGIENPTYASQSMRRRCSSLQREARKYLYDIQQAAALIAEFTDGRDFQSYLADRMLRAAVEREFTIIGEALGRLAKLDPALVVRISEHRRIIAFRNVLIHGYASVNNQLVWGVVETNLSVLRQEVE